MAPRTTARLVFFVLTCFNFGFRAAYFGQAHGWLSEANTAEPRNAAINARFCRDRADVARTPGLFLRKQKAIKQAQAGRRLCRPHSLVQFSVRFWYWKLDPKCRCWSNLKAPGAKHRLDMLLRQHSFDLVFDMFLVIKKRPKKRLGSRNLKH